MSRLFSEVYCCYVLCVNNQRDARQTRNAAPDLQPAIVNVDPINAVLDAWRRERPELDLTAVGLVARLSRAVLLLGPLQEKVFVDHGLHRGEFDVLATLRRSGAPYVLTPSELAATLILSRGGMTARLDRLEAAGLVDRALDPDNRASFRITLTSAGFEVIDAAMTAHTANLTELVSDLSLTEQVSLDALLSSLLGHLSRR